MDETKMKTLTSQTHSIPIVQYRGCRYRWHNTWTTMPKKLNTANTRCKHAGSIVWRARSAKIKAIEPSAPTPIDMKYPLHSKLQREFSSVDECIYIERLLCVYVLSGSSSLTHTIQRATDAPFVQKREIVIRASPRTVTAKKTRSRHLIEQTVRHTGMNRLVSAETRNTPEALHANTFAPRTAKKTRLCEFRVMLISLYRALYRSPSLDAPNRS